MRSQMKRVLSAALRFFGANFFCADFEAAQITGLPARTSPRDLYSRDVWPFHGPVCADRKLKYCGVNWR